jgi:hypothetical protein
MAADPSADGLGLFGLQFPPGSVIILEKGGISTGALRIWAKWIRSIDRIEYQVYGKYICNIPACGVSPPGA